MCCQFLPLQSFWHLCWSFWLFFFLQRWASHPSFLRSQEEPPPQAVCPKLVPALFYILLQDFPHSQVSLDCVPSYGWLDHLPINSYSNLKWRRHQTHRPLLLAAGETRALDVASWDPKPLPSALGRQGRGIMLSNITAGLSLPTARQPVGSPVAGDRSPPDPLHWPQAASRAGHQNLGGVGWREQCSSSFTLREKSSFPI